MTFIPLNALQSRREQGLSPMGGSAPKEAVSQALQVPVGAKLEKLAALLALQWNHPGDVILMSHIVAVVGNEHSRAQILMAAQYARSMQTGCDFSKGEQQAYQALVESVQAPK